MKLSEKAVLARLATSMPGESRHDKALSEEFRAQKNLGEKAGKWMKKLFPPEAMENIKQIVSQAREKHYALTLPWDDAGWRILPTGTYMQYQEAMREFKRKFLAARDAFDARWDEWVEWAKIEHNGTFNPTEYNRWKCFMHFKLEADFQPVPTGDDFRVELQAEDVEAMQSDLETRLNKTVTDAHTALWERVLEPVQKMAETLASGSVKFHDTLVTNITDILDLAPKLDLVGDEHLAQMVEEIRGKLTVIEPRILREEPAVRTATMEAANEILARVGQLMPKGDAAC